MGRTIGKYKIVDKISEDPFGTIFKSNHIESSQPVAMRIFTQNRVWDKKLFDYFSHVTRYSTRLKNPGIMPIYKVGTFSGAIGKCLYTITEHKKRISLEKYVFQNKSLSEEKSLDILNQLVNSLAYLHSHNSTIHVAPDPKNIYIYSDKTVKLNDILHLSFLVQTRDRLTPNFLLDNQKIQFYAPENWQKKVKIDSRADIFSLGVLYYYMLTGAYPLIRPGTANPDIIPIHRFNNKISPSTEQIVNKMLAVNRSERYLHFGELLNDIEMMKTVSSIIKTPKRKKQIAHSVSSSHTAPAPQYTSQQRQRQFREPQGLMMALFRAKGRIGRGSFLGRCTGILIFYIMSLVVFFSMVPRDIVLLFVGVATLSLVVSMFCQIIKRLHDLTITGWALLLLIVPYINIFFIMIFLPLLLLVPGSKEKNHYGEPC